MDRAEKVIVVTGATGNQGGAVARHLLAEGWRMRAVTRDPSKPRARALSEAGAEVVRADLDDRASLDEALRGAYGVYSMQTWRQPGGTEAEVRQGVALADAARTAGVEHFVYSSVGGAERRSGIPHFESKYRIEMRLTEMDLPHTVVRPVSFMENFRRQRDAILGGRLQASLALDVRRQLVAVDDIGRFVALALREPSRFLGTATELAGDALTPLQEADVFSRALGRPVQVLPPPPVHQPPAEDELMRVWLEREGYKADIPALRRELPGLMTLEDWMRAERWTEVEQPAPIGV